MNELEDIGLKSVYHHVKNEKQGKESQPTLFLQKNPDKAYHIDYFFVSGDMLGTSEMRIAEPEQWLEFSDHAPAIYEFRS